MIDRLSRRAWIASGVLHGVVIGLALHPPHRQHPPVPIPPAAAPAPAARPQRLILVPSADPASEPLPALPAAALPGWSDHGLDREPADVITPRTSGAQDQGGSGRSVGTSPVQLPSIPLAAVERATRFDTTVYSQQELSLEQQRLGDMAILLEQLLREAYHESWSDLKGPLALPDLFLEITVDEHGRVVQGRRLNSVGSPGLDAAIDRWLQATDPPISLPPISPGVAHVVKVSLDER